MSIIFASISLVTEVPKRQESQEANSSRNSAATAVGNGGIAAGPSTSDTRTLLEYSAAQGNNLSQITKIIQEKISSSQGINQMSYVYDGYYFHFIHLDYIVYLALTGEEYPRRKAFEFLAKLKSAYLEQVATSSHDDFEKIVAFHPTLEALVKEYSKQDAMDKMQKDVEQVKNIMTQNIEKVLNRGERIDNLVDRTESLTRQSLQFRSSSRSISRDLYFKNMKMVIITSALVIVFLFFLIFLFFK